MSGIFLLVEEFYKYTLCVFTVKIFFTYCPF